jgi:hypothetical protein
MKRVGKKTKKWIVARKILVDDLKKTGEHVVEGSRVFGICKDCGHYHQLQPDHKIKRSQGGSDKKENIDWICNTPPCCCHDKRDNQGDIMNKKNQESKKAKWEVPHNCKSCGRVVSMFICHHCGKASV